MTAAESMSAALIEMTDHERRTPCQGRYAWLWTSEDYTWRAVAIPLCTGCDLLACCAQYGDEIKASAAVYGGTDRTRTTRRTT